MDENTHDLVRRLFALLTAKLEDGAAVAAEGQHRDLPATEQDVLAKRLRDAAEYIASLADAISMIASN